MIPLYRKLTFGTVWPPSPVEMRGGGEGGCACTTCTGVVLLRRREEADRRVKLKALFAIEGSAVLGTDNIVSVYSLVV